MSEDSKGEQAKRQLKGLKDLRLKFTGAHQAAVATGDHTAALHLKGEIEQGITALTSAIKPIDVAAVCESNRESLTRMFTAKYSDQIIQRSRHSDPKFIHVISPRELDYAAKREEQDPPRFGEYTINPDTQNLDFNQAKILTPEIPWRHMAALEEAIHSAVKKYDNAYYFPGIEYCKWLMESPDKVPEAFKDGSWCYFLGSLLRDAGGRWTMLRFRWINTEFEIEFKKLGDFNVFDSDPRAVLIKK